MGVFISNAITDRGRILLGEAQVGATFEATRIVMGSGFIPAGYTARTMTAVVTPVVELAINKKRRAGDGTVTFGGVYSNENITEPFYFREFALYARVEYADGTYSDEVLYSYGNAGENADLMPAYSTSAVVEKQMDLVTWVGNDTVVNLNVTSGVYSPHAEKHAADGDDPITPKAIGALPVIDAKSSAYDMDSILLSGEHCALYETSGTTKGTAYHYGKTGFASASILSYGRSTTYGYQIAFIAGASTPMVRYLDNGTIGEWGKLYGVHYKPTADDVGALARINAKSSAFDMDTIIKNGIHLAMYETNVDTLGTPSKYGKTTLTAASILSYANSANFATQVAFLSGGGMAVRYKYYAEVSEWFMVYHTGNAPAVIATAELV